MYNFAKLQKNTKYTKMWTETKATDKDTLLTHLTEIPWYTTNSECVRGE